jgi:hypothetical protein
MTMVTLGFTLELGKSRNILYLEKQMEKSDLRNTYREQLFSDFYEKLKENNIPIIQSSVEEFIINNANSLVLIRGNGKLYIKSDGVLILKFIDESSNNVFECYSVKSIEGKLKFVRVQRVYTSYNYDL